MTHLVSTFRQALVALVPIADAVAIGWRDDEMYDDWDRLEETLFDVLVDRTIQADLDVFGSSQPIGRYGFHVKDYADSSWVEVVVPGRQEESFALVRLQSAAEPFDTVGAVRVEGDGRKRDWVEIPWTAQLRFRAQLRVGPGGALSPIESVAPD